jgi:gliding motility-associated-like protein
LIFNPQPNVPYYLCEKYVTLVQSLKIMKIQSLLSVLIVLFLVFVGFGQEIEHNHSIEHAFIENKGQWNEAILFKSPFQGGNLWVQQNKFVFHLRNTSNLHALHANPKAKNKPEIPQTIVHLNFLGSNKVSTIEKSKPTPNYYNYFIGNDKEKWASNVYGYGEAVLKNLYNGIDLKLIEANDHLKYEFIVAPHVAPSLIQLNFAGQKSLKVDSKGNLRILTALGEIIEKKPFTYQIINGKIIEVACAFKVTGMNVYFELGKYNDNYDLIIDPVLVFATYSGSVTDNFGMTATYAHDGKAYSGGIVFGNAYPMPDASAYDISSNFTLPENTVYGITDVFISKYSVDGTTMLWSTFIGGGDNNQGSETVHSLIADAENNVYLYGATSSTDFPIQGGFQTAHAGGTANSNFYYNGVYFLNQGTDIYVAKISANGQNLMGSTYIGGAKNDGINTHISSGIYNSVAAYDSLTSNYGDQFRGEIMLDENNNCLVASCTRSLDFPTVNAFQGALAGGQDGVLFKMNNSLSSLLWSSYFGGGLNDACYSVKVDSSYNVVFSGGTSSTNLPNTSGGYQASYQGGKTDGFVGKINPSGTSLTQVSYIGTNNYDQAFFVEIDRNDNVFLLGQSEGGNFPVLNAGFSNPGSSQFICKLSADLTTLVNSTIFGNGNAQRSISPSAFMVDVCGNMYVSGWGANILQGTPLSGMPVTADAYQFDSPNGFDFYLMVLGRSFNNLLYGTYLGGNLAQEHVDGGTSRFDKNGVVYQSVCGGCGGHSDFPTSPGAWSDSNLSSNCNNIIFKFDFELIPKAEFLVDQTVGCVDFEVEFQNISAPSDSYMWDFGNGDTTSIIFSPVLTYDTPGIYEVFLAVTDSVCLLTDTAKIVITVVDSVDLSVSPDIDLCNFSPTDLIAFTNGSANSFVWSSSINFLDTLNESISDSVLHLESGVNMTYYCEVSNGVCSKIDSVVVHYSSSDVQLTGDSLLCIGDSAFLQIEELNSNYSYTHSWSPSSQILVQVNPSMVIVAPNTTQYFYVTTNTSNGCVLEDSILVQVSQVGAGSVSASSSAYLVPEGDTVQLSVLPAGYTVQWTPSTNVMLPTESTTEAIVDQTTLYHVTVSDGICEKSDTVLVKTYPYVCGPEYVFIPNAFSPNGDGENDVLYVRGAMIKEMTFRVYTRWGELIFESFDRSIGWDGTFRGKPMDPDVYDYYLEYTCIDDQHSFMKGNITLLK